MSTIGILIQRTPESLGFKPETEHPIYGFDHQFNEWWKAGTVRIKEVADNFLLGVVALVPINDSESGDFYPVGTDFTAYLATTADGDRVLSFIPCPPDEDDMEPDDDEDW